MNHNLIGAWNKLYLEIEPLYLCLVTTVCSGTDIIDVFLLADITKFYPLAKGAH